MVTDVYVVYNDDKQLKEMGDIKVSPFFHFIDDRTREGRKQAFKLKGTWGTKITPFAICFDKDKPVKAFYSEVDENIIGSLIKYLNE